MLSVSPPIFYKYSYNGRGLKRVRLVNAYLHIYSELKFCFNDFNQCVLRNETLPTGQSSKCYKCIHYNKLYDYQAGITLQYSSASLSCSFIKFNSLRWVRTVNIVLRSILVALFSSRNSFSYSILLSSKLYPQAIYGCQSGHVSLTVENHGELKPLHIAQTLFIIELEVLFTHFPLDSA
jgi:hypothetical protein